MPGLLTLHWQHSRLEKWKWQHNWSAASYLLLEFFQVLKTNRQTNTWTNEHKAAFALALISNSKLGGFLGEAEPIQKTVGSEKVSCLWVSTEVQGFFRRTHQPPPMFSRWSAHGSGWALRLCSSRSCSGWVAGGNPGSPCTSPGHGSMGETGHCRQIFFWLD